MDGMFIAGLALVAAASGLLALPGTRFLINNMKRLDMPSTILGEEALPESGTILFVAALPGEAELACGGILPKLIERGNKMYLALLTDGRASMMPLERFRKRLIEKRREQQRKAAAVAGFTDALFYGLPARSLPGNERAMAMIETLVKEMKPSAIFAYDPEGPVVLPDMTSVGAIAAAAAGRVDWETSFYFYMTEKPNMIVDVTATFEGKLRLLHYFGPVYRRMLGSTLLAKRSGLRFGRAAGVDRAEGFRREISTRTGL